MKAKQRVNQRSLTGAVRPKQANRPAAQIAAEIFEDWPAAEPYAQAVKFDDWGFASEPEELDLDLLLALLPFGLIPGFWFFVLCACTWCFVLLFRKAGREVADSSKN